MKSKKKLKITIISLSIFLCVLIGGGIAGFYIAGNYIFNTLLESYVEEQIMSHIEASIEASIEANIEELINTAELPQATKDPISTENIDQDQAQTDSTDKASQVIKPAFNKMTPEEMKKMTPQEIKEVVQDKTKEINEAIPAKDKLNMSTLILSNLSQEDIKYLTSLIVDGVSSKDLAEAKKIAKSRFTEEQLEEVAEYYKRYADIVLDK